MAVSWRWGMRTATRSPRSMPAARSTLASRFARRTTSRKPNVVTLPEESTSMSAVSLPRAAWRPATSAPMLKRSGIDQRKSAGPGMATSLPRDARHGRRRPCADDAHHRGRSRQAVALHRFRAPTELLGEELLGAGVEVHPVGRPRETVALVGIEHV